VVLLFICSTKPLRVKDEDFNRVTIWCESINGLAPDPDALITEDMQRFRGLKKKWRHSENFESKVGRESYLGAGVNGVTDIEATTAV